MSKLPNQNCVSTTRQEHPLRLYKVIHYNIKHLSNLVILKNTCTKEPVDLSIKHMVSQSYIGPVDKLTLPIFNIQCIKIYMCMVYIFAAWRNVKVAREPCPLSGFKPVTTTSRNCILTSSMHIHQTNDI